jgi:hypothetical protein
MRGSAAHERRAHTRPALTRVPANRPCRGRRAAPRGRCQPELQQSCAPTFAQPPARRPPLGPGYCSKKPGQTPPETGATPLHLAAESGHNGVIESLVRAGANIDAGALKLLCNCHTALRMFRSGVLRAGDNSSTTPLHYAAVKGAIYPTRLTSVSCSRDATWVWWMCLQATRRPFGFSLPWAQTWRRKTRSASLQRCWPKNAGTQMSREC